MKKGYKIYFTILATILVLAIIAIVIRTGSGTFLTKSQKDKIIARTYIEKGEDAALEKIVQYYGYSSDDAVLWAMARRFTKK